ncbi:MAG: hypothetical protein EXR50_08735 [Dehalococcoidia bacterium]|nr:hypothetical protein [Dehalococcoidia bacterium]
MLKTENRIASLESLVNELSDADREKFSRIYGVHSSEGWLNIPETMEPWVKKQFGSLDVVRNQRIVRVLNKVTFEDAMFNPIRSQRPMQLDGNTDLYKMLAENTNDPLSSPLEGTPADVFGRIRGRFSMTAGNVAKIDGFSSLVVFDNFNPLEFTKEQVADYLQVALWWGDEVVKIDNTARYFFFLWNCLWKAGASLVHGHAQMTMGRDVHYGKIEHLRLSALRYRHTYGAPYFDDLFETHEALGLGFERNGIRVMAHLTPTKEREVLIMGHDVGDLMKDTIYHVLRCFRDGMGVTSFNLVMYMPPFVPTDEDWTDFPVIVRLLDRGDHAGRTSDMGAMELYASTVVSSDPFEVARSLREWVPAE